MPGKFITTKIKTKVLMQYVKDYEVRDALTLGIVFRLWSELEVLDKGVFLDDLTFITEEPLLIISCSNSKTPTRLTYKGAEHNDIGQAAPYWYLNTCTPNPYVKAIPAIRQLIAEIEEQKAFGDEFMKIYKEALMVLINGALKARDKKQFMALSEEWRKIA